MTRWVLRRTRRWPSRASCRAISGSPPRTTRPHSARQRGTPADELYGEMLRTIVERDAAGVFPLVDRLLEAGADLGEFVNGAAETLRSLLLVGVGGQPEGMTEGLAS